MFEKTCTHCRHQRVCARKDDQGKIQEQVDKIGVSEGFVIVVTCKEWESSLCNRPVWEWPRDSHGPIINQLNPYAKDNL